MRNRWIKKYCFYISYNKYLITSFVHYGRGVAETKRMLFDLEIATWSMRHRQIWKAMKMKSKNWTINEANYTE